MCRDAFNRIPAHFVYHNMLESQFAVIYFQLDGDHKDPRVVMDKK